MIRVRVKTKNLSPLLMNPMTEEILDSLDDASKRKPKNPDKTAKEICEEKLYRDNGKIGIPSLNLYAALIGAGKFIKINSGGMRASQITTGDTTLLPAFLTIEEFFLPFKEDEDWVADKRRGVSNQDTAVRLLRPRFDTWSLSFTLTIDDTQLNEKFARQLVEYAGSRVGLCDFRPTCRGPFGRFAVTKWEVIERIEEEKESE